MITDATKAIRAASNANSSSRQGLSNSMETPTFKTMASYATEADMTKKSVWRELVSDRHGGRLSNSIETPTFKTMASYVTEADMTKKSVWRALVSDRHGGT